MRKSGLKVAAIGILAWWTLLTSGSGALANDDGASRKITEVQITGAKRTRESWLRQYLDLSLPQSMTESDFEDLRSKLLTTGVFVSVSVTSEPLIGSDGDLLKVSLTEKWTTIPVIRGAYGGGTPLKVFGIYDSHVFGSLWTVGAETRQYGTAPPGVTVWARAPRWLTGRHAVGGEFWREFRERTLFNKQRESMGVIRSDATKFRGFVLLPCVFERRLWRSTFWQCGVDIEVRRMGKLIARPEEGKEFPEELLGDTRAQVLTTLLPSAVFDTIAVEDLQMDGVRLQVKAGPTAGNGEITGTAELQTFVYARIGQDTNIAFHGFMGQATDTSFQSQYFLGGFDSVRGLPDGVVYGNHATFVNLEARYMAARWSRLHVQSVLFADSGAAGDSWGTTASQMLSSAGAGVRLSIPQVNRLVFRVDYAWALDGSGTKGIAAGLNQFFDPYRPL